MPRVVLFCSILFVFVLNTSAARCEVIHGFQTLQPTWINVWPVPLPWDGGFDFSTQTVLPHTADESDISYGEEIRGDGWIFHALGYGIVAVEVNLEDLQSAPAIPQDYTIGVTLGQTYVMRTDDNLYVKFAVREWDEGGCCSLVIEYYVQMDGSPNFGPLLPVRSSTWGQVKALYR
jgi:hypothetical protein